MSTAVAGATPARAKPKAKKTASSHPPYFDMVKHAIKDLKERNGSSRQAIAKYIKAHYKVDDKVDHHLKRALVSAVKSGKLQHTKGIGASGSFKLAEKASVKAAAKPKVAKSKAAKKTHAKKPAASKPASAKKASKPKAKKPAKAKTTTPKKPKTLKPKKPVAKKTPKKVVKKAK